MDRPFPAYKGTEPYVFVCYAHRDSRSVYPDLALLNRNGIHVWYDEGIPAGRFWRAEIAQAIKGAIKFIFFISEASINSSNCLREVDYAINNEIEIIPVYLESTSLPAELELVFNRVQALFRKTDSRYSEHLVEAIRDDANIAALPAANPRTKTKLLRAGAPIAFAAIGLIALFAWMQWDSPIVGSSPLPDGVVGANAFDRYLEGLELLERWDKDDNLDRAESSFREASALDPSFALAFARLADALRIRYLLTGEKTWLDQATESVEEAMRLNAGLAPVQVALGRVHYTRGNVDLAFAILERALALDGNDPVAHQAIANVYARLGRSVEAEASFQIAIALDPESPPIRDSYANFLYDQGRLEDAERQWEAVLRIAPDHYAALVNLGSVLTELGRFPEAITTYHRAIEIRPSAMAYSNLGTVYSREGRYQDAIDAYWRALQIDDMDWLVWGNLAFVYSWTDETESRADETFAHAIQLAEGAREQNPRDPFVHSDLALYYAKTGQPELARQRAKTAIALSPDSGEILAAIAEAYELIGQRDEAVDLAKQSFESGYAREQLQRNPELVDLLADPRMQALP